MAARVLDTGDAGTVGSALGLGSAPSGSDSSTSTGGAIVSAVTRATSAAEGGRVRGGVAPSDPIGSVAAFSSNPDPQRAGPRARQAGRGASSESSRGSRRSRCVALSGSPAP
ncbi:MAG TPA: hypothetical protein VNO33_19940, partial [Kofleriaceae bacterium]|nr:hypothetical protein [Kofleriaceae bacterium]